MPEQLRLVMELQNEKGDRVVASVDVDVNPAAGLALFNRVVEGLQPPRFLIQFPDGMSDDDQRAMLEDWRREFR